MTDNNSQRESEELPIILFNVYNYYEHYKENVSAEKVQDDKTRKTLLKCHADNFEDSFPLGRSSLL